MKNHQKSGEKRIIRVSVRALVEFLLRSGNLSQKGSGPSELRAMQAGGRIHRKIQRKRGTEYQAEVPLKYEKHYERFTLVVEGRADGIERHGRECVVEEIKGIYAPLAALKEPVPVHLAQVKCYAAMYARREGLAAIRTRMTYSNLETEEIRQFEQKYETDLLWKWFEDLCGEYFRWADLQVRWEKKRDASMRDLEFPFVYRPGQRDMVAAVYRTIMQGKQIFIQASTGIGKTISAVFPAVRAVGEGFGEKIFYLTARTMTRTVAEEAFSLLRKNGLSWRSLTITAKEKICVCEKVFCEASYCPRAEGHFDRINDALYDMISGGEVLDRENILKWSEKWQVCPYEMQMDLTAFADAVICDYNYVFDPDAKLSRFFGETARKGDYILLIDEAHNLAERGRDMFSAGLSREEILEIRKLMKGRNRAAEQALSSCSRILRDYQKTAEEGCHRMESISHLLIPLMNVSGAIEDYLTRDERNGRKENKIFREDQNVRSDEISNKANAGERSGEDEKKVLESAALSEEQRQQVLDFYFRVNSFLHICDLADEHYLLYYIKRGQKHFLIREQCVNPAANLQRTLDRCRSAVFFSATLLPVRYYMSLLTTKQDNYAIYITSPFPKKNRLLLIGNDVSSVYRRRGPEEYGAMADYIEHVISSRKGNYIVFFPSYRMLEDVFEAFIDKYGEREHIRCICQNPSMRESDRESFLGEFSRESEDEETLIGFCVMGGVFSEGIDLTGERLIGVIVVGTGLPQVSQERELLRKFLDERGQNGFDLTYRFPGMNKVLQAAGRVIRTDRDRGVIVLLDERFLGNEYRRLFPREWDNIRIADRKTAGKMIREFWSGFQDGPDKDTRDV